MVSGSNQLQNKLPKRRKENDNEGMFNKLPESLINHILSFLSIEDVVRTSVLSKKWRYQWTCISKLDLSDEMFYLSGMKGAIAKQWFLKFVNKAIFLTNPNHFSLSIGDKKYDASLVNTWISSVLTRRVKVLKIESYLELSFSPLTSHFLFKSIDLEELVLKMYLCAIEVPATFIHFGHLKILKLSGLKFTLDSCSSNSENLRLSLPVLKKFETQQCTWLIANAIITLEAPLLEMVLIKNGRFQHDLKLLNKCTFKFTAMCLKEFTFHAPISQDIVLLDPSSVHNASADIIVYKCKDKISETENRVVLLLKQFSQVQYLKFEGLEGFAQSRAAVLPQFGWLRHLELGLVTCEVMIALLQKSPVLMTLAFKELPEFDPELLNSASVPDCFMYTLQKVKFGRLHGYEHELCFAKFVMQNCSMLERLSFSRGWPSKSEAIEEFKEKLFSFKKGFRSFAIVEFSNRYVT